jgi:hypothetical protein
LTLNYVAKLEYVIFLLCRHSSSCFGHILMSIGQLVVLFVSISMRMHVLGLFGVCCLEWVHQIGVELCCKVRVCVIFVKSSLFIMFLPYLNELCSIGGGLSLNFNENAFLGLV